MEHDNSSHRVTQYVRRLAAAQPAGARLPSVRDLMRALHVSPVTVQVSAPVVVTQRLVTPPHHTVS